MHDSGTVLRKQPVLDAFITVAMASICSMKSTRLIKIGIGHVAVSARNNMQSGGFVRLITEPFVVSSRCCDTVTDLQKALPGPAIVVWALTVSFSSPPSLLKRLTRDPTSTPGALPSAISRNPGYF